MLVSEYMALFFQAKGIRCFFGFQGSAMLKMAVEFEAAGISYIQNFHEQASAFAADGFARASGKPAVAMATSGPGAANLIGGIADAYFDGVPVFFVTGQYNSQFVFQRGKARQNGFQDMDVIAMTKQITKAAVILSHPEDIKQELNRLWEIMLEGRKGPVLLDIPIDFQFATISEETTMVKHNFFASEIASSANKVTSFLKKAVRPLFLIGGGVRQANAIHELHELASITKIPIISSMQGLDGYGDIYGLAGIYGETFANLAIKNADLLLIIGCRLGSQHMGKDVRRYTNAKIIHVDIDPTELGRVASEELSIQKDIKVFLKEFISSIKKSLPVEIEEWRSFLRNLKAELKDRIFAGHTFHPIEIAHAVMCMAGNPIVIADVGQNQVWTALAYRHKPGMRFLSSGGYGSMGFSLPAAIGASYACPDTPILSFTGDGGFHMNQQELLFLQLHQRNVKCIVFNNSCLGLMREAQKKYYKSNYIGNDRQSFQCVNLERLSQVYDLPFCRIENANDLSLAHNLINSPRPCLIEAIVDSEIECVNVFDEMEIFSEKYKAVFA